MGFEFWKPWTGLAFLPREFWEYPLLAFYILATFALLIYAWRDFRRLAWRRLPVFVGLLASLPLANHLLVLSFSLPGVLPPPSIPVEPAHPYAPLLGMLPVMAAGAWLGAGPALLAGLVSGILRVGMVNGGITDPFYFAFLGFLVGFLLRQDYQGRLPLILRQPVVVGPLAAMLASPFLLLSVFAHVVGSGLAGLDYAVTLTGADLGPALLETLTAAIIVQLIYTFPRFRPVRVARQFPPYARSLSRRILLLFVPLILLMTFAMIYAVTKTTLRVATLEVVDEMERNASGAANDILFFFHTGQGLLEAFASDEVLWHDGPAAQEARLHNDRYSLAFFNQLVLFDSTGEPLAMDPSESSGDPELTDQEQTLLREALESGAVRISTVHRSKRGEVILSFLVPAEDAETGKRLGVLLGRTRLDEPNPAMAQVLASLQWVRTGGEGFVVDENVGRIVAHSDPSMLLVEWHVEETRPALAPLPEGSLAYESRSPRDNSRQLVYYSRVEGYSSWAVVIRLPYEVVLEQATQIATPLLLLQLLLGGGLVVIILLITGWLTRPLKQLATAADRIAEGDLTQAVQMPGKDEVARVGDAFEGMRVRLKDRLEDLSLLLQVSQAVSATLELPTGMPLILEGLLKATQAQVARIVFLSATGDPQMVMGRGEAREGLGALDRSLATAAKDLERPLSVENLARARTLAGPETLNGPIKAVIALPVRTKDQVAAVMWVGYGEVRQFDAAEIDLLSTLAGQTAVLVENARLFQAAEGGRRRLAAILTSTTDAVLVTDRDDLILLVNPAAERAFGIAADAVVGREAKEAGLAPALTHIFEEPLSPSDTLTEEVPLPGGRTLYASVSTIVSADGERIGRVAVMRDITRFKELDELKSEFVATVSHDLRSPLTFMRGYASMLPMVGELSDKQREYVEKILHGVGQMSELIDDLLDLGRIEAGVGLERDSCHLGTILVEAVDGMRARAAAKGLTLRLEQPAGVAVVSGDAALLRQVVSNLVDNAVKYTPSGGTVAVGLSVRGEQAVIQVADTGIGIAPDDQVRLFEKFYRIKRRDTADIPGSGLGLAIVKSIVERHGGRVWVESTLGQGSTFYASLPMGEVESQTMGVSR